MPGRPQRAGRGPDPGVDAGDEVELPRPPLDLPHAERGEDDCSEQAQDGQ
jgi:hypothetical protein